MRLASRAKYICWIAVCCLLVVGGTNAWAKSDESDTNHKSPIFDGVKQVFVHVHYNGAENKEEQAALPVPLRKQNIEALLMQLYKQRFSSKDCTGLLKDGGELVSVRNKYGCDDQPVVLLTDSDYYTYQSEQARKQPGTLNIEFQVGISSDINPPVAALYIVQDRSDPQIPTEWEITFPYVIPLSLDDENIRKRLYGYIRNRIR